MNKGELIRAVSQGISDETYNHITQADIIRVVDAVFEAIKASLANGDSVNIRGFGAFDTREYKHRECISPNGERVTIPSHRIAVFKPGCELKASVNPG